MTKKSSREQNHKLPELILNSETFSSFLIKLQPESSTLSSSPSTFLAAWMLSCSSCDAAFLKVFPPIMLTGCQTFSKGQRWRHITSNLPMSFPEQQVSRHDGLMRHFTLTGNFNEFFKISLLHFRAAVMSSSATVALLLTSPTWRITLS